ncbi:hypothetical protein IDM40_26950 [Nocardiopsis sp. HNM0947]|uniref:ABC-2 type transport system permease protein n=1 Tax=Nocardiopsis coralli TaxID=2772213 RepID=A0ABR9PER7_9ACTN|nr:hypothetical protein [Nocardiopsis coralli]MBE3002311.1 hypothetical protein [Nocardiopsis coralli]
MRTDRTTSTHDRRTDGPGTGAVAWAALRAETGRLLTLPWTWLVLAAAFTLVTTAAVFADAEIGVAGAGAREAAVLPDTFGLTWSIQVLVVLAAVTAGADLRAGELVNGLICVPDRRILVMARTAVLVGAAVAAGVPLLAVDRWIRHTVSEAGVPGGAELLSTAAGYLLSAAVFVLLATTLAHLLRHAMAALAILLLMPILLVPLLGRLFPRASEVLPHNASAAAFTGSGQDGLDLTTGQGFALLLGWALVLIAVHTLVFVRRDH